MVRQVPLVCRAWRVRMVPLVCRVHGFTLIHLKAPFRFPASMQTAPGVSTDEPATVFRTGPTIQDPDPRPSRTTPTSRPPDHPDRPPPPEL